MKVALLRKIYEKRSYIMAAIEAYLLRNSNSYEYNGNDDNASEEAKTWLSFLDILRRQQRLRSELVADGRGMTNETMERLREKYRDWNEQRLNRLLSLLNDLYRQVQTLMSSTDEAGDRSRSNDVYLLAAVTGNNFVQKNFNLLSDIYSVVFRLM